MRQDRETRRGSREIEMVPEVSRRLFGVQRTERYARLSRDRYGKDLHGCSGDRKFHQVLKSRRDDATRRRTTRARQTEDLRRVTSAQIVGREHAGRIGQHLPEYHQKNWSTSREGNR